MSDVDRLVEQARELLGSSRAVLFHVEVLDLLAGLADAVEQSERHNDLVLRAMAEYREERDEARARVAALEAGIRRLHPPVDGGLGFGPDGYGDISPACPSCGTYEEYAQPWPCPTAALLDGRVPSTGQET